MTVVKINAIEVPDGAGPELERRFAARHGSVESAPGFLGFELLRPVAGDHRYFVYTRWESEDAYRSWRDSSAFTRGHAQAARDRGESPVAQGSSLLEYEVVQEVAKSR